jgi:hypothetical protein
LHRAEQIAVRDAEAIEVELYRSNGGGFVTNVDRDENVVITRRMAHMFRELQGVNMLAALFDNLSFDDFMTELFSPAMQSDIIHSHLEIAANTGQVAAAMNGLTSALPDDYDRRFPLVRSEAQSAGPYADQLKSQQMLNSTARESSSRDLPEYISVAPPTSVVDEGGRFIAWNSPFSTSMPCKQSSFAKVAQSYPLTRVLILQMVLRTRMGVLGDAIGCATILQPRTQQEASISTHSLAYQSALIEAQRSIVAVVGRQIERRKRFCHIGCLCSPTVSRLRLCLSCWQGTMVERGPLLRRTMGRTSLMITC